MQETQNTKPSILERLWKIRWPLAVTLITLIGLGLRIWKAWAMRFPAVDGDVSVTSLMAKHMAEGTDYPVFCYGVAYMGSLEPALSALMARIAGVDVSAFILHLSPALVGTLILPLIYLFARDAGSRRAGILAMIYCLIGSPAFFYNSVAPRGGYSNMMVGGLLALWLACQIATKERRGEHISWRAYFWMGLAAGVAWWVTQLAAVFLLSACLVLLIGFRWRMVKAGMAPALAGFFLGSLPWWAWNITHQWGSLNPGGTGTYPFHNAIENFWAQFQIIVELFPYENWINSSRLVLMFGLFACFVLVLINAVRRKDEDRRLFYLLAPVIMIAVMIAAYTSSPYARINTARYLMPIFPAVAVIAAVAADWLIQRFRLPLGWLAFALVIPAHTLMVPHISDDTEKMKAKWNVASEFVKAAPLCDGVFVGDHFTTHWLNFASSEKICVATPPLERYAPYARRSELAERRAYLANFGDLRSFLRATAASSSQTTVGGILVDYAVTPPSGNWRYVEPADIAEVTDGALRADVSGIALGATTDKEGASCRVILTDSIMDSSWSSLIKSGEQKTITFRFSRPVSLCGIRFLSLNSRYPRQISIDGKTNNDAPWQPLLSPVGFTAYFWSGSYVMIDGFQFFQECRFPPPAAGITEARLTFCGSDEHDDLLAISETLFMETAPQPESSTPAVSQCIGILNEKGITNFYAPRWLAERIAASTSNRFATLAPSVLTSEVRDLRQNDSTAPHPLAFGRETGLFVDSRDLPRTRSVLQNAGFAWKETPAGSLVLLVVPADKSAAKTNKRPLLYWTEQGCFSANAGKQKAQEHFESATNESNTDSRIKSLQEALRLYPNHQPARQALTKALVAASRNEEAAANDKILKTAARPDYPGKIRFKNGVEFLGINVAPLKVTPGQSVDVTYFWKCPANINVEKIAAFVHFQRENDRFQDDHVLLLNIPPEDITYQPFEEIFTETRRVAVPLSTPPGNYQILVGLVDRVDNERLGLKTELHHRRRAVELPIEVEIAP